MADLIEELELKLKENFDDEETWSVLSDVLIESGDVLGESIALDLAVSRCKDRYKKSGLSRRRNSMLAYLRYQHDTSRLCCTKFQHGCINSITLRWGPHLGYLLSMPHFRFLQELVITPTYYGPENAADYDFSILRSLKFLDRLVVSCPDYVSLTRLFEQSDFSQFTSIKFYSCNMMGRDRDGRVLTALETNRSSGKVVDLRFHYSYISDVDTKVLLSFIESRKLQQLTVNSSIPQLATCEFLKEGDLQYIKHLALSNFHRVDSPVSELFWNNSIAGLMYLDLSNNLITNKGAKLLAECKALSNLKSIAINGNKIDAIGLHYLANSPYLSQPIREGCARMISSNKFFQRKVEKHLNEGK